MRITRAITLALACLGCAGPIREFYPDAFFPEDRVYENKTIRFSLTFKNNWDVETDPNRMDRGIRKEVRRYQKMGVELLFAGTTSDGLHGVSAIASSLNETAQTYAETIRTLNKDLVSEDAGLTEMLIAHKPMVRWQYRKFGLQYAEFFFTVDTYNVRVAFWSQPALFERFHPVYTSIMSSLESAY